MKHLIAFTILLSTMFISQNSFSQSKDDLTAMATTIMEIGAFLVVSLEKCGDEELKEELKIASISAIMRHPNVAKSNYSPMQKHFSKLEKKNRYIFSMDTETPSEAECAKTRQMAKTEISDLESMFNQ